jgi:hypothetical protein
MLVRKKKFFDLFLFVLKTFLIKKKINTAKNFENVENGPPPITFLNTAKNFEKKFVHVENGPPPITFLMVRPLKSDFLDESRFHPWFYRIPLLVNVV